MTDALQLLRDDHKKVKDLFKQFEDSGDKAEKKRICDEVIMELDVHTRIEEEIFYPAVLKEDGTQEIMEEAEEEHHVADMIIEELRGKPPTMKNFDAKFKVLSENVKHHIDEEEQMMLPKAAEMGREKLERLGVQMEQRKMELMQRARAGTLSSSSRNGVSGGRSTNGTKRSTAGRATAKRGTKRAATGAATKVASTARATAKRAGTAATTAKRATARATGSRSATGTRSATGMTRTRASGGTRSTAAGRSAGTTRTNAATSSRSGAATRTRGQASASRTAGTRAATTRRTTATGARKATATRKPSTTRSTRSKS